MMRQRLANLSLCAVALAIAVATPGWANDVNAILDAPDQPDAAQLADQLADLEAQIEAEREALHAARQRAAEREQELRDRRETLAADVVDTYERLDHLDAEHQQLQQREQTLRNDVDALLSRYTAVVSDAQAFAEQALIALEELPGEERTREQLRTAITTLNEADAEATAEAGDALATVIGALDRLHARGTSVTLREAEVWNAAGERETVSLLMAGHVGFAYQSTDGERMAIALGSPTDAAGYRWTKQLPPHVEGLLRQAFISAEAGEAVTLPLDVSGELRVEAVGEQQSWADVLGSGGMVMIPLGLVALAALLLVIERAWVLYARNGSDERLVGPLVQAVGRRDFEEAERIASRGRGTVARTLAACLSRRNEGAHAIEDSVQEQLLHELPRLQRFLGGIAILAAVAPLLGLLGTVTGIIETFGVIRAFGDTEPGLMAGGISEALITTATGLSIAIPILLVHAMLRGRVDRIIADAERHAATLVNTLATLKRPASTPDPAEAATESQEVGS